MAEEIKSSVELAMEKLARLPRLSEQEIQQREDDDYRPRGTALARRYLAGELSESRLDVELHKEPGSHGEIVRGGFLSFLCHSMTLDDATTTRRALDGIRALQGSGCLGDQFERFTGLAERYRLRRRQELAAAEEEDSSRLRDLGISGSAIRVDPRDSTTWSAREAALLREFEPQAGRLRQEMLDELLGSR